MSPVILKTLDTAAIESILTITPWFGSCSALDHKALQGVTKAAERCIRSAGHLHQVLLDQGYQDH